MSKTYYDILGVPPQATHNAIKTAFRQKAQIVHPDKIQAQTAHLDPYAAERLKLALEEDFRELKEAYDVLSDARQRREYDDLLKVIKDTSGSAPSTQPPSQAPHPSSTCTACGAPLVRNHCAACAKRRGTSVLISAPAAVFWTAGSLLALFIAVILPKDDLWDADTCIGLLVLSAIATLVVKKGLWGGIKRLCKTHPKMGALAIEAVSLAVLSLVVGAFNSPSKVISTQTQTSRVVPATTSDVKPAAPEFKPAIRVNPKRSGDQSLTGQFGGTVKNQTARLSADFAILVKDDNKGTLSGCMVVNPPLFGSGPLSGVAKGSRVSFVVVSSIGEITFNGQHENDVLQGTYIVRHATGAQNEHGTFLLQQGKSTIPASTFHGDCLRLEPPAASTAPIGNPNQAPGIQNSALTKPKPMPTPSSVVANGATTSNSARATSHTANLSSEESASLESACSQAKYLEGPAAYDRCVQDQLYRLAAGPRRPDLSALSQAERQSIESACSRAKYLEGPAAYNRCLQDQLDRLAAGPRRPDLSALSQAERQSIESACSRAKYLEGPAAYDRCLQDQLYRLAAGPRRPDLSALSQAERQSIESACSRAKYLEGPAAYNRCLVDQLNLLKTQGR